MLSELLRACAILSAVSGVLGALYFLVHEANLLWAMGFLFGGIVQACFYWGFGDLVGYIAKTAYHAERTADALERGERAEAAARMKTVYAPVRSGGAGMAEDPWAESGQQG